jgi:hypothetical protein
MKPTLTLYPSNSELIISYYFAYFLFKIKVLHLTSD